MGYLAHLQGIFLTQGVNLPGSLTSPALAGGFFTTSTTWEAHTCTHTYTYIPSFCTSFPFRTPECTEFPVLYSILSLVIYFIHNIHSVYVSTPMFNYSKPSLFISNLSHNPLITILSYF